MSWVAENNGSSNGDVKNVEEPAFRIFVGYDPREDLAYEVCRHSILKRSSIPVEITPIKQSDLRKKGLYWRERGQLESTEFSFSRFLTPCLAGYEGWAMFVDCDFLYLADIKELRDLIDDKYAVMCVQHDYAPKETTKMDGAVQTVYPRKNWSSMVLYNCGHPKNRLLTPDVVNSQTGAFLHRFQWLEDADIGSVPFVWNFLEGHNTVVEADPATFPKAIHYTRGGPWFQAWKHCDFADLWLNEKEDYLKARGGAAAGGPLDSIGVGVGVGMGKGVSSILSGLLSDYNSTAQLTLTSQNHLSTTLNRLTRELDQLLENAPLPFIMHYAAKISSVRKRVLSLNSLLKSIQQRLDSMDRRLSLNLTTMPHETVAAPETECCEE